ncbi:hypothetical protein LTR64_004956 [Lithohypha guttulata]|uniref:uncharacterized protein n=1 Tax=Lithohypha guttulata TaxID=1690604 RepID=UPI002DE01103|nr:hypothetical protein LTR51_005207 [Lithohypha guttulata]
MHSDLVSKIIDFSSHLQTSLQQSQGLLPYLCSDVLPHVASLPLPSTKFTKSQKTTLKTNAVAIWNCCNIIFTKEEPATLSGIARLRGFACLLLISIGTQNNKKCIAKLFENALVAARDCLHTDNIGLAEKLLEHVSGMQTALHTDDEAEKQQLRAGKVEYVSLRVLLHWRHNRYDLANHALIEIIPDVLQCTDEATVEKVADLCYEIGNDFLCKEKHDAYHADYAMVWLEWALDIVEKGMHAAYFRGSDLRLNVLHRYVQALNGRYATNNNIKDNDRALEIVERLRDEYGLKLSILVLDLETRFSRNDCDPDCVVQSIEDIIKTVYLIESNHRLILYYIQKLSELQHAKAMLCLKHYVSHRLVPEKHIEWAERAIVSYTGLFVQCSERNSSKALHLLEQDMDFFCDTLAHTLSPSAARAAHVLIWRMIRQTDDNGSMSICLLWCRLGLHRLFELAGESACGKLERQIVSYHLLVSNHSAARQILDQMSFGQRSNKHSRLLMFCLAMASGNDAEAQSCLNTIVNSQGEHDELLFACVGETIKYGRKLDSVRLLQRILDKHMKSAVPSVDVGALLEYTASILIDIAAQPTPPERVADEVLTRLCCTFKNVAKLRERQSQHSNRPEGSGEMNWSYFQRQSFDLARKHANTWPGRYVIDLLDYTVKLCSPDIDALPGAAVFDSHRKQRRDAIFMQAVLYASEARHVTTQYTIEDLPQTSFDNRGKPKTSECQITLYQHVFNRFCTLKEQYQSSSLSKIEDKNHFLSQLHVLIPLAFEALLFMTATAYLSDDAVFDEISIEQFLSGCGELQPPIATYALLADILLTFASGEGKSVTQLNGLQVPSLAAAKLLGNIIQALRKVNLYDLEQASRWVRCVAQLIFDDIEQTMKKHDSRERLKCDRSLTTLASVIEQAQELATLHEHSRGTNEPDAMSSKKRKRSSDNTSGYPPEELQWLVSEVFNMAVDLHALGQQHLVRHWASQAVNIATVLSKDYTDTAAGGLIELLRQNIKGLKWDVDYQLHI